MVRKTVIALAAALSLTSVALAQQAAPTTDGQASETSVETLVEKVAILTRANVRTAVPELEARAVDLDLVEVPGISKNLTKGVTAKAYARYVTVDGEKIGQVVLTGVEKDGRAESLNSTAFIAQFDMKAAELDPAQPITVEGDKAEMRAALERLAEQQDTAAAAEEEKEDEKAGDPTRDAQIGSNDAQNADAAGYQNPEPLAVAEADAPLVRIVTDGCAIRVDTAQGFAIQQSRVETTEDGNVSSSACEDSEVRYPLQRSYSVCSDSVDLEALKATAQYVLFYTDAGGARQEVTECVADEDQVFDIVEDRESCPVFLDYSSMQAVTQAALIYKNANNATVQVRGCEASGEVEAVALVETTDGCSIRHDFNAGRSYQQGRHTYELDGVTWQAGACADTGTEYAHEKVYLSNAGAKICSAIVDQNGGNVTMQYRVAITKDSLVEYITECKPDDTTTALISTTEGCTNPFTWNHDVSAGVSYGMERFFYMFNGVKEYVTQCQQSETTYAHQVETAGWEPHDDQLFAYQKSTVYIMAPSGRYNVVTSEVVDGTPQMAYTFESDGTQASGEYYYEDCSRFERVDTVENYKRPDDTIYAKPIGEGTPLGPVHACEETVDKTWPRTSLSGPQYVVWANPVCTGGTAARWQATYQGKRKVVREDGEVIIEETKTKSELSDRCPYNSYTSPSSNPYPANSVYCSNPGSFTLWGWTPDFCIDF